MVEIKLEVEGSVSQGQLTEVFDLILDFSKDLTKFSREFSKKWNLTPPQYAVLNFLEKDVYYAPSYLAEKYNCTRPTMTVILNSLQEKELITRQENKKDGRQLLISLTKKGFELKQSFTSKSDMFNSCNINMSENDLQVIKNYLTILKTSFNQSCGSKI